MLHFLRDGRGGSERHLWDSSELPISGPVGRMWAGVLEAPAEPDGGDRAAWQEVTRASGKR